MAKFLHAWPDHQSDPGSGAFVIVPGTSEFGNHTRGIYVGGAGDIVVVTVKDQEVFFSSVPAGTILPIRCKKVLATGTDSPASTTTATLMVGLY